MRRRSGLVLLVASATVVVSVAAFISFTRPTSNSTSFGESAARGVQTTATSPSTRDEPAPRISTQPAVLPTPSSSVTPTGLEIPAARISARVAPTGVDDRGEFAVPPSIDTVGWYRFGASLASGEGSIVIGGHVDGATEGPGAFYRLTELRSGDEITVTGDDGSERRFRVVAREQVSKKKIDLAPYFAVTGPLRLTLFTCGGEFDSAERSYVDNVVVTAVPS
ncbi:class F sortase [Lentzea sp. NPDC058450]|uniref:class F sortase n=1 Tax=Lentzea sp. NPDC058450 TaxID=3346505 RepID=UPI00365FA4D8